jgi:hypothetical protein
MITADYVFNAGVTAMEKDPKVQGEGDYEAARRHRKRVSEFIENNDVEKAAVRAAPETEAEAKELADAEEQGKERAKGEDPALRRGH